MDSQSKLAILIMCIAVGLVLVIKLFSMSIEENIHIPEEKPVESFKTSHEYRIGDGFINSKIVEFEPESSAKYFCVILNDISVKCMLK